MKLHGIEALIFTGYGWKW